MWSGLPLSRWRGPQPAPAPATSRAHRSPGEDGTTERHSPLGRRRSLRGAHTVSSGTSGSLLPALHSTVAPPQCRGANEEGRSRVPVPPAPWARWLHWTRRDRRVVRAKPCAPWSAAADRARRAGGSAGIGRSSAAQPTLQWRGRAPPPPAGPASRCLCGSRRGPSMSGGWSRGPGRGPACVPHPAPFPGWDPRARHHDPFSGLGRPCGPLRRGTPAGSGPGDPPTLPRGPGRAWGPPGRPPLRPERAPREPPAGRRRPKAAWAVRPLRGGPRPRSVRETCASP